MKQTWIALAVLAAGISAWADSATVSVRVLWPDENAPSCATIHAAPAAEGVKDIDAQACSNPSEITLPYGQWFVSIHSKGYWTDPQLVFVREAAALTFVAVRATHLRATARFPDSAARPRAVLHVQTVVSSDPFKVTQRSIDCPVTKGVIECDAPQGTHDLVFRVPGFASVYRWSEKLDKPKVDLGALEFRRGSTLSGRVEFAARADPSLPIDVSIYRPGSPLENDETASRKGISRTVVHPNARGTFVTNLEPGRYGVRAVSGHLISQEEEVIVVEGQESMLRTPLRLSARRMLVIAIRPSVDPWDKRWKVTLSRLNVDGVPAESREVTLPITGTHVWENLPGGAYRIDVHRSPIDSWAQTIIELDSDRTEELSIPMLQVRGTVTIGDEPLAAWVVFSLHSGLRLPARSLADGTFATTLPVVQDNRWDVVEIGGDGSRLPKVIEDVKLTPNDAGIATVDLRLKSCAISGTVLDIDGRRVSHALVTMTTASGQTQQIESDDGEFAVKGLDPGRLELTAATREAESEKPEVIELAEADPLREITLIVRPVGEVRGVVRSSFGPAMNAVVFVTPADLEPPVLSPQPVDASGAFKVRVPAGTHEVNVSVGTPGFAYRMYRMAISSAEVVAAVDQAGGTLTVVSPTAAGTLRPYLIHGGAAMSASSVAYLGGARPLANLQQKLHYAIPLIEAGSYSLCWMNSARIFEMQASRCATGMLAVGGTLTLRAPEIAGQ